MYVNDEDLKKEFAKCLRKVLRKNAMTQTQLADTAEISRVQINHYIQGRMLPSFYNLSRIAAALNCSLDEFRCF